MAAVRKLTSITKMIQSENIDKGEGMELNVNIYEKNPHRRARSVLPYYRVDDTYLTQYPWNRAAHSRHVCEGLFLLS